LADLISVEANTVGALGMDRGSGFEQLENCPEYEEANKKTKASKGVRRDKNAF
jgi:hypothetical protein